MAKSWLKKKIKSLATMFGKSPKKVNPIKGAGNRKASTKADDKSRAKAYSDMKTKDGKKVITSNPIKRNKDNSARIVNRNKNPGAEVSKKMLEKDSRIRVQPKKVNKDSVKNLKNKMDETKKLVHGQKKNGKFWNSKTGKWVKALAGVTAVGGSIYAGSKLMGGGDNPKKKKIDPYEIKPTKPKATKPKTGNPGKGNEITKGAKPKASVKSKAPVKKKSRSNISNSSSYDAKFTADNLRKQGRGESFVKGRMSKGNYKKATTLFKGGKASNYYSGGGTVFTGR